MAWTPLDETIASEQAGHVTDHEQIHDYLNKDFDISWEFAYVHSNGSDTYDGLNRRFPKATIPGAISAGFDRMYLGPTNHIIDTPIVRSAPLVMIGVPQYDPRWNETKAAYITTSGGTIDRYFDFTHTATISGGLMQHIKFDNHHITNAQTSSAIRWDNVNRATIDHCSYVNNISQSTQKASYLLLSLNQTKTSADNSWNKITDNYCIRASLYGSHTYGSTRQNRWLFSGNVVSPQAAYPGNALSRPAIDMTNGWPQQFMIVNNSFEYSGTETTRSCLMYFGTTSQPCDAFYVAGNTSERVNDSTYFIDAPEAKNSFFEARGGEDADTNNIRVRGATVPEPTITSSTVPLWADAYGNTAQINKRVAP